MNKILHAYEGTEQEFLKEVKLKYISQAPASAHPEYLGVPNTDLDEEFSEAEIRAVLHKLNTKSAPGPDAITNKTLRNLDDTSIGKLRDFNMNVGDKATYRHNGKRRKSFLYLSLVSAYSSKT